MKDRIKQIRKIKNLTQQEFATKLGIKRSTISNYEMGRNTPVDSVISLICREFHVNEEWLRNGTGEMFVPQSREDEIENTVRKLLTSESDSFKSRFISMLARLSTSDWERLESEAIRLLDLKKEEMADSIEPANIQQTAPMAQKSFEELSDDERVELYRRHLELERKAREKPEALQDNTLKSS